MLRPLAFAALLVAAPAFAQDGTEISGNRTPANAQKFLAAAPPDAFSAGSGILVRQGAVNSTDACVTELVGVPGQTANNGFIRAEVEVRQLAGAGFSIAGRKVTSVIKYDSAYQAGLRTGDEILSVDAQPITSQRDLDVALTKRYGIGASKIVFLRGGRTLTSSVAMSVNGRNSGTITIALPPGPISQMSIEWSKIQSVGSDSEGGRFYIYLKAAADGVSGTKWIAYSVSETRDRVLAAAQYLKDACDKSKELGF